MRTKQGFTKMSVAEFEQWLKAIRVGRTILKVQQHHTYSPSYVHFNGTNHFERQQAMKNHHVGHNGWADIGQHFTIFPDGSILTGRNLEKTPACITGNNANSICIENFGNFDLNGDVMTSAQKEAIVEVTALLCKRFGLAVNTNSIVYHHWYDLNSGVRNNGTKNNKSCPGTNFFGGNKVQDCETKFLPLVRAKLSTDSILVETPEVLNYVVVTAKSLNVRVKPASDSAKATDRSSLTLGSVLRVFKEKEGWLKISNNQEHWIFGKYTKPVQKALVTVDALNVRSGSDASFPKVGSYLKGEKVFVVEEKNSWCKVSMDEKWISKKYLKF